MLIHHTGWESTRQPKQQPGKNRKEINVTSIVIWTAPCRGAVLGGCADTIQNVGSDTPRRAFGGGIFETDQSATCASPKNTIRLPGRPVEWIPVSEWLTATFEGPTWGKLWGIHFDSAPAREIITKVRPNFCPTSLPLSPRLLLQLAAGWQLQTTLRAEVRTSCAVLGGRFLGFTYLVRCCSKKEWTCRINVKPLTHNKDRTKSWSILLFERSVLLKSCSSQGSHVGLQLQARTALENITPARTCKVNRQKQPRIRKPSAAYWLHLYRAPPTRTRIMAWVAMWLWLKIQELRLRGFALWFHLARCNVGTFIWATAMWQQLSSTLKTAWNAHLRATPSLLWVLAWSNKCLLDYTEASHCQHTQAQAQPNVVNAAMESSVCSWQELPVGKLCEATWWTLWFLEMLGMCTLMFGETRGC